MSLGSATVAGEDEEAVALMVRECEALRCGNGEDERRERDGFGGVRVVLDDSLGMEGAERRVFSLRERAIFEFVCYVL